MLDEFLEELIRRAGDKGYVPYIFMNMRERYGSIESIERLVKSVKVQTGFKKLRELALLEWSIEAAVVRFPDEFTKDAFACAQFRLANVNDPALRK